MKYYRKAIIEKFGDILSNPAGSIIMDDVQEADFWSLLIEVEFNAIRLIEIGTALGISTLLLAERATEILTFDIKTYDIKHQIWREFGVDTRIRPYLVKDSEGIRKVLEVYEGKFDAAFIDGNHDYTSVKIDIDMVKSCGKILFHDWHLDSIKEAVRELHYKEGGELCVREKFAYWIKNGLSEREIKDDIFEPGRCWQT